MRRFIGPITAFLFPFLYYFRFVVPNSSLLVIENDFDFLYYRYKAYLVDLIAHGHFPWWSPAEAGGYSFFGNPFTAPLYPLNALPLIVRLLVGSYNAWFHQIYTVFGVSIFAVGMYRWLHQVYGKAGAALFTSVTLSACWSIAEFMRFPNAIHTIAWVPWVLAVIHSAHFTSRLRPVYFGMVALFCEITAGYPYFVVYSFFLYAAYVLYLHWTSPGPTFKERLVRQMCLFLAPVLLLAPYASAISAITKVTRNRGGGDFGYATEYPYSMVDLVGSFVFPPVVTVEGCLYPGLFAAFLIALYFWWHPNVPEKVAVLIGFLGFLGMMLNYRSYIFTPLWSFLPIVNQMRAFPRMSVITLPILAVAIHEGYVFFADQIERAVNKRSLLPRAAWIVFGSMFAIQIFLYFVRERVNTEYIEWFGRYLPAGSHELDFLMSNIFTFVVVLCVMNVDWSQVRHGREIAFVLVLVLVTQDTGIQGRFLWTRPLDEFLRDRDVASNEQTSLMRKAWAYTTRKSDFFRLVRDYFVLDRLNEAQSPWPGALGLTPDGLTVLPTPDFDFESYWRFFERTKPDDRHRLMGKEKFFFDRANHGDAPAFLADNEAHSRDATPPRIEYFDGSELRLGITTTEPGYLTWIDNFNAGWSATVDDSPVSIERSMGTFKAVNLRAAGEHHVRFVYRPVIATFSYGLMTVGLLVPALLALWERRRRRLGLADAHAPRQAVIAG
jgi:hypothetical protein